MTVYAVFRTGIYRHECLGIFSMQAGAILCAEEAATHEPDPRHGFEVVPFEVNERTPMEAPNGYLFWPRYPEPKPTFVTPARPK